MGVETERANILSNLARTREEIMSNVGPKVGPVMIPKKVDPNLSRVEMLRAEAARTTDPKRRAWLEQMAALEERYATKAADAQNVVQEAAQRDWDPVMQTPDQMKARMDRRRMEREAALEQNMGMARFGLHNPADMKSLIRWDL